MNTNHIRLTLNIIPLYILYNMYMIGKNFKNHKNKITGHSVPHEFIIQNVDNGIVNLHLIFCT